MSSRGSGVLVPVSLARKGVRSGRVWAALPSKVMPTFRLGTFLGRLTEISAGPATAALTFAFRLVHEAQQLEEPVAWITAQSSSFYPPDVSAAGVDLAALAIIRVAKAEQAPRVADPLVRSGGFGLIVLDLCQSVHMPIPVQTRLAALAKKHNAALVCLTEKTRAEPSLGSLVSLRVDAVRVEKVLDRAEERYCCAVQALKDKRRGGGWKLVEVFRGVDGLC